jgi:hypothetical protein
LHDRIVAATVGRESHRWMGRAKSALVYFAQRIMSPQMAVAAMILALISLLVISRFGSVSNLTTTAENKVESLVIQGQQKIHSTGAMARSGFLRVSYGVNSFLFSGPPSDGSTPASSSEQNGARPTPQPQRNSELLPESPDSTKRDKHRRRQNQSER